jgi:hypothetical protein
MLNSLMLLAFLSTASAEDFTVLSEDQPAPFEGVLLSVPAAAEILAKHEEAQLKCELELEFQLDTAGTQCKLDKKLLEARIVTLDQQYTEVIASERPCDRQATSNYQEASTTPQVALVRRWYCAWWRYLLWHPAGG